MRTQEDQIRELKQLREQFKEDPRQHELSAGTCSGLITMLLMDIRDALNRCADELADIREDAGSRER